MAITYKIQSKDNSSTGRDIYRAELTGVPNLYKPTLTHEVVENQAKTNRQQNITIRVPVRELDMSGKMTSKDSFVVGIRFTSLQHVVAVNERAEALDSAIAYLTAARASLLDGGLPDNPLVVKTA